jgi:hypothetical protein
VGLLGVGVDGEDHALAAVSAGLLLAVEPWDRVRMRRM